MHCPLCVVKASGMSGAPRLALSRSPCRRSVPETYTGIAGSRGTTQYLITRVSPTMHHRCTIFPKGPDDRSCGVLFAK